MRLTPLGAATAVTSAAVLALGYLLGYQGIALVGAGGLAAIVLSGAAVLHRPPVRMSRHIYPPRVVRGEPATGMLTVHNVSRWLGLRIQAYERCGRQDLPVRVPHVPRGARREIAYQIPTGRRGIVEVGPLRWERRDPLGMLRRSQPVTGTLRLYVHPVIHPVPLGAALRAQRWDSAASDTAAEGTITFHTLREYVPGDDLRQIHWRSSARVGTLMVRKNIDPSIPLTTVLLVTGRAAYPDPERFEDAVEVAASALVAAARERLPVRLLTSDGVAVTGGAGHDDARRFLDFLAGVTLTGAGALAEAAARLERAKGGAALVVATGSADPPGLTALRRLSAGYREIVVALLGDQAAAPGAGNLASPVPVVAATSGAQFCARWQELPR